MNTEVMKEVVVWTVSTNSDLTEGRGREHVKHYCSAESTAIRLAKGGYVQGTDCPVSATKILEVDGKYLLPMSFIRIEGPSNDDIRMEEHLAKVRAAKQKAVAAGLTDEEIGLLSTKPKP